MGKNVPNRISATFDCSPMPNQMMNSGNKAIFGIANSAATSGARPARTTENSPIAKPTTMPSAAPALQPRTSRCREALRWRHSSPDVQRSPSAASASLGAGRTNAEITPVREPISHTTISTMNRPGPTKRTGRGAKPPPRNFTGRALAVVSHMD